MAEAQVNILVKVRDEATASMNKIGGSFDTATKGSKAFALGLGALGVAAGAGLFMAVKAAGEAEVAMAKMSATLKSMGPAAQANESAILAAASAATKLGFDDEDAALSVTKLYQRTNDVNQAMKLNALAMDLARAKSIDLGTATDLVGKVLSGQGRALKEYGIELDETTTPLQALDELQVKVAGNAAAFGNTFEGQAAAFNVAWGNLLETLGEKLLPLIITFMQEALIPLAIKLGEWAGNIEGLIGWMKEHQTIMIIAAGAITGLLVPAIIAFGVTLFTSTIPALIATAVAMAPFLIGGAIIGGIVAGIFWLVQNWDMLSAKAMEVFGAIGATITGFFTSIDAANAAFWAGMISGFKTGVNFLIGAAEAYANAWVTAVNTIIGALNKIQVSIPDWVPKLGGKSFGINLPTAPGITLPRFAAGGIVTGPTVGLVGEAGPEAIIPLSRLGGMGFGSVNITLNADTVFSDDINRLADQLGDAIMGRLNKSIRL